MDIKGAGFVPADASGLSAQTSRLNSAAQQTARLLIVLERIAARLDKGEAFSIVDAPQQSRQTEHHRDFTSEVLERARGNTSTAARKVTA